VGAFNHLHIFIDPSPDAKVSFEERRRLFNLPRCVWADYDASKISQGGGVFSRKAKSVTLSKEMKQLFSVSKDKMTPDELIKTLLTLDVDLLWSAGIGTFVKATDETNFEVSDRANDALRVDGASLRCKVVGEGGNLGFTQKARIQYDLHGGRICTDFIDNSAGVDCSDHEVNIKILLNHLVAKRKLSLPDRNALLAKMTKEVSALVLRDNYRQTQAISLSYYHAAQNLDLYIRVLCDVTQRCKIDSELENLPSLQVLLDRKQVGKGITRPELSMLMAHIKIYLKQMVLDSGMLDKGYFKTYLYREFPSNLYDDYKHVIDRHYLKNEIIATQLSNTVIDQMGITFLTRLQEETGASMLAIIKAFIITKNIFNKDALWEAIELLDLKVEANVQFEMMKLITQLIRRGVRWFLCNHDHDLSVQKTIEHFKPLIDELSGSLLDYLSQESQAMMLNKAEGFVKKGVPEKIAHAVAFCHVLLPSLDLVDTVMVTKKSLAQVASAYFYLGDLFDFAWLRNELTKLSVTGAWDALALVGFRDDLDRLQHVFTIKALKFSSKERNISKHVLDWFNSKRAIVNRFELIKSNMRSSSLVDPVMISVGLRELFEIARRL